MRRRRLGLLLVLVPATLGPATAAFIWSGSGSGGQAFWLSPTLEEAPGAQRYPISSDPAAIAGEGDAGTSSASGSAPEPSESQPTSIESAPGEHAPAPAHVDSGEAIGMPLLANTATTQSTAASSISSQFRPASIGARQFQGTQLSGDSSRVADLRVGSIGGAGGASAVGARPVKPGKGATDDSYGDTASADGTRSVDASPNAPGSSSSDPMSSDPGGSGSATGRDGDIQPPPAPSGGDAGPPHDETNPPQGDSLLPQNNSNLSGADTNPPLDDTHPPPDTNPNGGGDRGQSTPPGDDDPFEGESGDSPKYEAMPPPVQVPEPASLGLMIVALLGCAACGGGRVRTRP